MNDRFFRIGWTVLRHVPAALGSPFRVAWLRRFGARIDEGVTISFGVWVQHPEGLEIASGAGIARGANLDARGSLHIGANTLIGFDSVLLTWTHRHEDSEIPIADQGFDGAAMRIGEGCWIGARAIIMPGVQVGDEAIVGAGSVVTNDVPARSAVAGAPARVLHQR